MAHEKEVLENQLEAEQEYIVHKLQKQAAHIAAERQALQLEKTDLKRQVCCSASSTRALPGQAPRCSSMTCLGSSLGSRLRLALHAFPAFPAEARLMTRAVSASLATAVGAGAQSGLAQVGELTLAVSRLGNEKVALEQSMEMEEEGIVNRLQRVIEGVVARNKAGPLAHHTCLSPSLHHISSF